jgi:hypothetical protein
LEEKLWRLTISEVKVKIADSRRATTHQPRLGVYLQGNEMRDTTAVESTLASPDDPRDELPSFEVALGPLSQSSTTFTNSSASQSSSTTCQTLSSISSQQYGWLESDHSTGALGSGSAPDEARCPLTIHENTFPPPHGGDPSSFPASDGLPSHMHTIPTRRQDGLDLGRSEQGTSGGERTSGNPVLSQRGDASINAFAYIEGSWD